jgi:hypothetical protein
MSQLYVRRVESIRIKVTQADRRKGQEYKDVCGAALQLQHSRLITGSLSVAEVEKNVDIVAPFIRAWPVITQCGIMAFHSQHDATAFVLSESLADATAFVKRLTPFRSGTSFDPRRPALADTDFTSVELAKFLVDYFVESYVEMWIENCKSELLMRLAEAIRDQWEIPDECDASMGPVLQIVNEVTRSLETIETALVGKLRWCVTSR